MLDLSSASFTCLSFIPLEEKDAVCRAICFVSFVRFCFILVAGAMCRASRRQVNETFQYCQTPCLLSSIFPLTVLCLNKIRPCSLFSAQHGSFRRSPPIVLALELSVAVYSFSLRRSYVCLGCVFTSYRRGERGPSGVLRRPRGRTLRRSCRRPCGRWRVSGWSCDMFSVVQDPAIHVSVHLPLLILCELCGGAATAWF